MNHDELRDSLWDLFDLGLDAARRQEIESHLGACAECRAAYAVIDRARSTLLQRPAAPTSTGTELFVSRTMARIADDSAWSAWRWLDAPWTLPALSLGFAAACLSILLAPPESSIAPTDTLMLLSGQSRAVAQWVLSPDQISGSDPLSLGGEESR